MNRMPVIRVALLLSGMLGISHQTTLAQSWTDFNSAVPKVGYPMTYGGIPVTSVPTLTPPPLTAGSIPYVANPTLVPAARNWKLGVYVRNSDLGAVVQTVEPGSASQAAGIVPGDIIVAVSTSRIGEFDGRVVDIGDEIRRFVDPYGRVSLLIQDGRTRALRATVVTLSSTSTRMTGTINVSDRGILPVGTVLTVQLQNRNKPFYEIAGGKTMMRAEGTGPFAFELNLDPRYIDPADQYQLTAFLSWNNQVIYSMPTPVVIPASGLNQNFALMLDRGSYLPGANASSLAWSANPTGNVVTAGYAGSPNLPGAVNLDALTQVFVTLLGRQPTSREILAWQSYMQQGHSLNEVTARIMASSQYRDRFTNDSAYMQQVLQTLTGKLPNATEVGYWVSRLQALGSPERVIAEILAQNR
ncbi:MAG: YbaY family lipoprotein [Pirellula sp.]